MIGGLHSFIYRLDHSRLLYVISIIISISKFDHSRTLN